jgi:hypothetical protein
VETNKYLLEFICTGAESLSMNPDTAVTATKRLSDAAMEAKTSIEAETEVPAAFDKLTEGAVKADKPRGKKAHASK